jgi:hypothetical protein
MNSKCIGVLALLVVPAPPERPRSPQVDDRGRHVGLQRLLHRVRQRVEVDGEAPGVVRRSLRAADGAVAEAPALAVAQRVAGRHRLLDEVLDERGDLPPHRQRDAARPDHRHLRPVVGRPAGAPPPDLGGRLTGLDLVLGGDVLAVVIRRRLDRLELAGAGWCFADV